MDVKQKSQELAPENGWLGDDQFLLGFRWQVQGSNDQLVTKQWEVHLIFADFLRGNPSMEKTVEKTATLRCSFSYQWIPDSCYLMLFI